MANNDGLTPMQRTRLRRIAGNRSEWPEAPETRVCKHCGITLHKVVMWMPPLQAPTTRHEQVSFTVANHFHEPAEDKHTPNSYSK